MYQRVSATDPDLVPPTPPSPLRPLTIILLAFLCVILVFGIYMLAQNESRSINKKYNYVDNTTDYLATTLSTEPDVTRPRPKVKANLNTNLNSIKNKYKIPDRVISEDKYFKMTDCSETDQFFIEYLTMEPLPFNIHKNTTINTQILMKEGFHWSTEIELELEKWFFGLKIFSVKLPCISDFFGSCRFNFCDMLRLHSEQQFCAYIHNKYDMNCQCPDVLGPGVFIMENWHYKPMRKILKYFSWFARGWYNLTIKLYNKQNSTKPFSCYNTHFKITTKHLKQEN